MGDTKELYEYTLEELYEQHAGEILLAIGKGEYRLALWRAMDLAMVIIYLTQGDKGNILAACQTIPPTCHGPEASRDSLTTDSRSARTTFPYSASMTQVSAPSYTPSAIGGWLR